MQRVTQKLILRVLSTDEPQTVASEIKLWVLRQLEDSEHSDRDTEIRVVIGLDTE